MVGTTPQPHRSIKEVKPLPELVGEKRFVFPTNKANDVDPQGRPAIMVQINSVRYFVPCGVETTVDNDVFCVLKDVGIVSASQTFGVDEIFDPVRNYDQR